MMRCEGSGQYCQNRNIGHLLRTEKFSCAAPLPTSSNVSSAHGRGTLPVPRAHCPRAVRKLTSDKCEWVSYFSPGRHVLPADFGASTGERNSTDLDVLQTSVAKVESIYLLSSSIFSKFAESFGLWCCTAAVVLIEVPASPIADEPVGPGPYFVTRPIACMAQLGACLSMWCNHLYKHDSTCI